MGFSERCAACIGSNSNVATSASNVSLHDHYCVLSFLQIVRYVFSYLRIFDLKITAASIYEECRRSTYTTIENACYKP